MVEMSSQISEKLVEQCRRGEHAAQMEFYSLLFGSVYNAALRITRNSQDAEEIAQEAFLKFFKRIDKYYDKLPHIVRRIAINGSIDLLRRRKNDFLEFSDKQYLVEDEAPPPNEDFDADIKRIKEAIDRLPTGYRLVITLRLIEDLSFEEVAAELGITASTARSQFLRAKHRLVELLGKGAGAAATGNL